MDKIKKKTAEYHIGALYVNPEKHIIRVNGSDINLSYKEYSLLGGAAFGGWECRKP